MNLIELETKELINIDRLIMVEVKERDKELVAIVDCGNIIKEYVICNDNPTIVRIVYSALRSELAHADGIIYISDLMDRAWCRFNKMEEEEHE